MDQYAVMAAALLAPQHQREQFMLQQALQAASLTQHALLSQNSSSYPMLMDGVCGSSGDMAGTAGGQLLDNDARQQQQQQQLLAQLQQQCNSPHLMGPTSHLMDSSQHMLGGYGIHDELGGVSPGSEMDVLEAADAHLFLERHSSSDAAASSFGRFSLPTASPMDDTAPSTSAHQHHQHRGHHFAGRAAAGGGSYTNGGGGPAAAYRPHGNSGSAASSMRGCSPDSTRGSSPPSTFYGGSPRPYGPNGGGGNGGSTYLRGGSPPPPRGASPPPAYGSSPSTTRGSSPPTRGSSPPPSEVKSDKAKLVDIWIESALLISKPPLDRRHFDRETRQNLKKMRPVAAQQVLTDVAGRDWGGLLDMEIGREVHRMVSHAKAQDKYSNGAPFASSNAGGSHASGGGAAAQANGHGGGPTLFGGNVVARSSSAGGDNRINQTTTNHTNSTGSHGVSHYSSSNNTDNSGGGGAPRLGDGTYSAGGTAHKHKFNRGSLNKCSAGGGGGSDTLFTAADSGGNSRPQINGSSNGLSPAGSIGGTSSLPSPNSGVSAGGGGSSEMYGTTPNVSFNRLSGGSSRADCDVDVSIFDGRRGDDARQSFGGGGGAAAASLNLLSLAPGRMDRLSDASGGAGGTASGTSPADMASGLVSYASSSSSGHDVRVGGSSKGGSFTQHASGDGGGSGVVGLSTGDGIVGHFGRLGDPSGDFLTVGGGSPRQHHGYTPGQLLGGGGGGGRMPAPDTGRKLYWWEG